MSKMIMMKNFLCIALVIIILPNLVLAEKQKIEGQFGNWSVFTALENGKKICYIVGEVIKEETAIKDRSHAYITISNFIPGDDEFSVSAGYQYKNNEARLQIDNKHNFKLATKENLAWPTSVEDDKKIINLLQKAKQLKIMGKNTKNQTSTDTYSLMGFVKAYKIMRQKCK